jgi:hypothetical protein
LEREFPTVVGSPQQWFHLYFPARRFTESLEVLVDDPEIDRASALARFTPAAKFTAIISDGETSPALEPSAESALPDNLQLVHLPLDRLGSLDREFDLIYSKARYQDQGQAEAELRALRDVLRPEGCMHLTLPGRYGLQGLTMIQRLALLVGIDRDNGDTQRLQALLSALCENDTLGGDRFESRALSQSPQVLQMLLRPECLAFSVPDALELVCSCGLTFQRFFYQAHYLPQCSQLAKWPDLLADVLELPREEKYAVMELYRASLAGHELLICREDRPRESWEVSFEGEEWLAYVPTRNPLVEVDQQELPPGAIARLRWSAHAYPEIAALLDARQALILDAIDEERTASDVIRAAGLQAQPEDLTYALNFFRSMWSFDYLWFQTAGSE